MKIKVKLTKFSEEITAVEIDKVFGDLSSFSTQVSTLKEFFGGHNDVEIWV